MYPELHCQAQSCSDSQLLGSRTQAPNHQGTRPCLSSERVDQHGLALQMPICYGLKCVLPKIRLLKP